MVQAWAELEEQLEIVEALTKDATDVLNERVNGTFADDANPSDNERELAGTAAAILGAIAVIWTTRKVRRVLRHQWRSEPSS